MLHRPSRGVKVASACGHQTGSHGVITFGWNELDQFAGFIIQSNPGSFGLDWIINLPTQQILESDWIEKYVEEKWGKVSHLFFLASWRRNHED